MKSRLLTHVLLAPILAISSLAQPPPYQPTSEWLLAPASILPFLVESADFWLDAYDHEGGGFFSEVGLTGSVNNFNRKAILIQSRNAYGMAKAFMVTGDEKYLDYAEGALAFMYTHGWDEANGGWWGEVNGNGGLSGIANWINSDRWSFWQHYMLLGIAAMVEVTRDPLHEAWLDLGNAVNDSLLWDATPGREGYYVRANRDWTNPRDKGFTPTVDAMTTNTTYNYLLTRDPFRYGRLVEVADNMVDHLVGAMDDPGVMVTLPSAFTQDWEVITRESTTSIGHFIKTGWCLSRAFLLTGDERYRIAAERIHDQVWTYRQGSEGALWNSTWGVPRGSVNWATGAITSEPGDWWTVEQAFTGPLMAWYTSGKDAYLEMADHAIDFWMTHYYDHTNGECFSVVNPTLLDSVGKPRATDRTKGQLFKGAYHSIELMYLVYLYGNLFFHEESVDLHYRFAPAESLRDIHLWPLEIEDDQLFIQAVEHDGAPFIGFESASRTVRVPPEGGLFKVTFGRTQIETPPLFPLNPWGLGADADGVLSSTWMGELYLDSSFHPWGFSLTLGWIHPFSSAASGFWAFRIADQAAGFLYTAENLFPLAYSHENQAWIWFEIESGRLVDTWRYDQISGLWSSLSL